jgi:hypothetical protein
MFRLAQAEIAVYGNNPVSFSAKSHFQSFGIFPHPSPQSAWAKSIRPVFFMAVTGSGEEVKRSASSYRYSHQLETDPDLPS